LANDALLLNDIDAYYGDSHVLHRVSLHLGEGRLLGLLGRNGAGKSTCMNVAVGWLPPRRGTVAVYGAMVAGRSPEAIAAQGVALVPQGRRVFRSLTVRENLAVAARRPRDRGAAPWDFERVCATFPRLSERRDQYAGYLSGGEQQMLVIGRALMCDPKVILLDEPSLGLAPLLVAEIFGIIRRLREERGLTVLLVEQNAALALDIADHGYVMENGRIVLEGPADALRQNSDIKEFYLGLNEAGTRRSYRDLKHYRRRKRWLS
jgi:branched-chain amino acid transport system ATP-binding protein